MSVDLTLDIQYSLNASDRELKLLRKNKITTSGSFLARKNSDLQKILNNSVDEIIAIKKRIRGCNIPDDYVADDADRGKSLADYFDEVAAKAETIPTGVPQLDELLPAGGIFTGEVIEICGRPASGKTMLIFTIILKALETDEDCEFVYFDTKNDFRAIKLKTMMIERKIPEDVHLSILKRITIKYVRSFDDLNLELSNMKRSELLFKKVKMIVIDSICTLAYYSMGDGTMYNQRMLITTKLIKILSGRNIAVSSMRLLRTSSNQIESVSHFKPSIASSPARKTFRDAENRIFTRVTRIH